MARMAGIQRERMVGWGGSQLPRKHLDWMGSSFEKLISSVSVSTSREEEGRKATIIASDSTETRAISERGRRLLGSILK